MGKSIYEYEKYICAPELVGRKEPLILTIAKIDGDVEFASSDGRKSKGWDIYFKECRKPYGCVSRVTKDQLCLVTGTIDTEKMIGKKIELFAIVSKRSESGRAIRIRQPSVVVTNKVNAQPATAQANTAQSDAVSDGADDLPYGGGDK